MYIARKISLQDTDNTGRYFEKKINRPEQIN